MSADRPAAPRRSKLAAEIAVRLRELRARLDLTQDDVARRIGCHESAISRWESGSRLPSAFDLIALARVYHVSCDTLLGVSEQVLPAGVALLDQSLIERLERAGDTAEFDAIVNERGEHAVWVPIEDGAVILPVAEAIRRAHAVADRHPRSLFAGQLFRPGQIGPRK